ncbi:helix-turn-helix domain-containing protein [Streptomyces sp. AC536]|uniref:helix-turn-helix domain-containing protein n=1 Tax=Streptomyces buecherae TaxID=2763006 RepID=UPI00164E4026|nr:helix-turn-helix transcriptional regulator [Streptomyces buecherae]MBC3985052.1 helix-turn-helix domain-containing protein [Streptomyces buecherae]QNJ42252.1 helix-turn-helix domain-containing protein [Streptomyces buecherae]
MTFDPDELGQSRADLAGTLKMLRKRAGFTQTRLAQRCNMSQTKISNIEGGKLTPSLVDVELILRAVNAPHDLAAQVAALARTANTEWQDVWSQRRTGLEKKQNELAGFERSSTELRYFLLSMVTGLLATPEYVRASLAHVPGDQSKAVSKKLERQAVLYDTTKRFTFILTEQAVRWPFLAAPAMAVQIDRLRSLSLLPNIRLGVIPLDGHIPKGPLNTFTVYDARIATVETKTGAIILRGYRDVSTYLAEFAAYESFALFDEECRERLSVWAERFRS